MKDHNKMKLDAVYTWVDSTNNEWILERQGYLQKEQAHISKADISRYESFDELKYSLRSLFTNCDFINRVFIVSNNGARPRWLKNNQNVIVVDDKSIFPNSLMVPNYNSNAIESCIHRIPGLSEHFIYMNDDFFITKNLSIGDLIDPSTQRYSVFMETNPVVNFYNKYLSSYLPAITYLGAGAAKARRYTYKKLGLDCINNIPIGHCCRIYEKNLISEFEQLYLSEINNTRHQRFRSTTSFCFCDAYAFHFARLKKVILQYHYNTKLIIFTDISVINHLQIANAMKQLGKFYFLAILDCRSKTNKNNIGCIQAFLHRIFPNKTDFEL